QPPHRARIDAIRSRAGQVLTAHLEQHAPVLDRSVHARSWITAGGGPHLWPALPAHAPAPRQHSASYLEARKAPHADVLSRLGHCLRNQVANGARLVTNVGLREQRLFE